MPTWVLLLILSLSSFLGTNLSTEMQTDHSGTVVSDVVRKAGGLQV
jgi:hypothetical protein